VPLTKVVPKLQLPDATGPNCVIVTMDGQSTFVNAPAADGVQPPLVT
jgi:hypothetical protein